MVENSVSHHEDEIDLLELFETIWNGKWLIASIMTVCLLLSGAYFFISPHSFIATTEIKPVNSVESERYNASNSLDFFNVTSTTLQNLFVEELETKALFVEAIRKFEIVEPNDFPSKSEYDEKVLETASLIMVLPPINTDGANNGVSRRYWSVKFEYHDERKWKNALSFVFSSATGKVREALERGFDIAIELAKRGHQFRNEDLDTQIENALGDYDRKTFDRLAYLKEQAAIARELGVAKNSLDMQTYGSSSGFIANVKTDSPFYLRGYEAIEKEIELIETRKDKKAFVAGLLKLEQDKRAVEQDRTIERAEMLFELTPVVTNDDFVAVNTVVEATNFEYKSKRLVVIALIMFLGGMVGIVVVLISGAMRKRKIQMAF